MPKKSLLVIFIGAMLVMFFAIVTAFVGGDALNGKIEKGRYYVRSGAPYKEVSLQIYMLSACACLSVALGLLLMINRVLRILKQAEFFEAKAALYMVLNIFFLLVFGALAIYSLITIVRAAVSYHA